jgi:hypothetical protein
VANAAARFKAQKAAAITFQRRGIVLENRLPTLRCVR